MVPRALTRKRKSSSSDTLGIVISALKVVKATSDAISSVPLLSIIASAALGLAETLQKVHESKEECILLGQRTTDLLEHITARIFADPDSVSPAMIENLRLLEKSIALIQRDVDYELRRSRLSRFIHHSKITSTISRCIQELDDSRRSFDTACLVTLDKEVKTMKIHLEKQARYDEQLQVRLYRWCDIEIIGQRGACYIRDEYEGDEYRAKIGGRVVRVREVRNRVSSRNVDIGSLLVYNPNRHGVHPNLAQVIGRSHPSVEHPFYVIEAGTIPLLPHFLDAKGINLVKYWLTHTVDFWSAFEFAQRSGIPVFNPKSIIRHHHHGSCLPSASLNAEGRLLLDASDFSRASKGCIENWVTGIFNEAHGYERPGGIMSIDNRDTSPVAQLLSVIQSNHEDNSLSNYIDKLTRSPAGQLWSVALFDADTTAKPGEYGYIERDGAEERFVCLGHLDNLLDAHTNSAGAYHRSLNKDCEKPFQEDHEWPDGVFSQTFDLDRNHGYPERTFEESLVVHRPDTEYVNRFFWEHAEDIAQMHRIPLHNLVLVSSNHYITKVDEVSSVSENDSDTPYDGPLHFHYLPHPELKEDGSGWGYWSLNADPDVDGTLDKELRIDGYELSHWKEVWFSRLLPLQAELIRTLNCLRRGSASIEAGNRFEEIS